jgi:hypothetical protein
MFPDSGDGFGGNYGSGGARVALDTEGLVLGDDDTFWISDEYGEILKEQTQVLLLTLTSGVRLPIRQERQDDPSRPHS